jgi:plasmid stabilization system protein ParE
MGDKKNHFTVNVNKTAKNDLREIIKYISKNNPMNALNILKKIEDRINTLNHFPERGGYVPELLKNNIKDYLTRMVCKLLLLLLIYRIQRAGN